MVICTACGGHDNCVSKICDHTYIFSYEYDHIDSFRGQLYIQPEDNEKIQSSILIKFDQTIYWLFLTADTVIRCLHK